MRAARRPQPELSNGLSVSLLLLVVCSVQGMCNSPFPCKWCLSLSQQRKFHAQS